MCICTHRPGGACDTPGLAGRAAVAARPLARRRLRAPSGRGRAYYHYHDYCCYQSGSSSSSSSSSGGSSSGSSSFSSSSSSSSNQLLSY